MTSFEIKTAMGQDSAGRLYSSDAKALIAKVPDSLKGEFAELIRELNRSFDPFVETTITTKEGVVVAKFMGRDEFSAYISWAVGYLREHN